MIRKKNSQLSTSSGKTALEVTHSPYVTTKDLFLRSVRRYPRNTALIDGAHRYSYSRLDDECSRLAKGLLARNVGKADRVALLARNCKEFVISYLAVSKIGAVLVPLNHRCVARELEYMLSDCDAKALIFESEYSDTVARLKDLLPRLHTYISVGKQEPLIGEDFDKVVSSAEPLEPDIECLEDDDCTILYTSGTTGKPKGAVITHRTRVWCTANVMSDGSIETDAVALQGGPLFHTGTTNISLLPHLAAGATIVLIPQLDPISIAEAIQKEKVTHICTVPTILHNMLENAIFERYEFSSLRIVYYGASTIPLKDLEKILSILPTVRFFQGYGQTESTQLTVLKPEYRLSKFGCTGRAHMLVDLRVVDEKDEDVLPGQTGEVITKGPHVMQGYLNLPEANRESFRNGWFHTTDVAQIDAEGFITIVGRKKDLIISGGENIYPREIELVLNSHPKILEAAVFGVPHPKWGESVCAAVILKKGETPTEGDIVEYCKENLASYKKPTKVFFCESFPRNTTGKIIKDKLKEIVLSGNA
jgi:acyl-CoA synthetase (AMP-forming)/AMP-acid ligase II